MSNFTYVQFNKIFGELSMRDIMKYEMKVIIKTCLKGTKGDCVIVDKPTFCKRSRDKLAIEN